MEKALEDEQSRVSNYLNVKSCVHFRIALIEELLLHKETVGHSYIIHEVHTSYILNIVHTYIYTINLKSNQYSDGLQHIQVYIKCKHHTYIHTFIHS